MRVRHLGKPPGVDRVLVDRVEFGRTRRSTVLTTSVGSHGIPSASSSR
jgi:hypothetical protein